MSDLFDGKDFKLKCPADESELALKLLKEFFIKYPQNKDGIITRYGKSFYVYRTKTSFVARRNY